jgi:hypothetical protein
VKRTGLTIWVLLTLLASQLLAAGEFEVIAATGALEPEGLQAGRRLDDQTHLRLEPWGRALIRETTKCQMTHLVVGMDDYLLTLAEDCSETANPLDLAARLQKGDIFAERIKQTGSGRADALVAALKDDPCAFLKQVSEEGDNQRRCPSGYALRGLKCTGAYCDNKDLLCCPYLGGEPDATAKEKSSRPFSEEFPNTMTSKLFLIGLTCQGNYCDNILPHPIKSSRLINAGHCEWTPWASEQPGAWLDCGPGKLVSGIRCQQDFCGDVGIYCCQAEGK